MQCWIGSYNCLSLRQAGRWNDVSNILRCCKILGLQGTHCKTDAACEVSFSTRHVFYHWGRGGGARNKATGVAVGLQKKWFNERNVRQIYTPAAKFQGRLGGLRIHSRCNDVFILVGYAPCEPAGSDGKQAEERRQEIFEFWTEVTRILNTLPQRCWPILLLDANAKVGRVHANLHCDSLFLDEHIGGENAERENYNGTHFRHTLQYHGLSAINTFWNCGPTFHHCSGRHSSRIDYICLPVCARQLVSKCEVWNRSGDALQLINCRGPRDHRPLLVSVCLHQLYDCHVDSVKWDHDVLNRAILFGEGRHAFMEATDGDLDPENCRTLALRGPDHIYEALHSTVYRHALASFQQGPRRFRTKPSDTNDAAIARIAARQRLRACPVPMLPDTAVAFAVRFMCAASLIAISKTNRQYSNEYHGHATVAFCQLRCRSADKHLRKLLKRDKHAHRESLVHELSECWKRRDFASCWRISRILSGRRIGPKKRNLSAPSFMCDQSS